MSDPLTIVHGDALSTLRTWRDESVQCVVTSPPYWGLRDYGVEPIVWSNHNGCEHEWNVERTSRPNSSGGFSEKQLSNAGTRDISDYHDRATYSNFCNCGAWRGCLGLEPTPEMYVSHLVEIFREVKRVLKKDGTIWLNLGDSYNANYRWGGEKGVSDKQWSNRGTRAFARTASVVSREDTASTQEVNNSYGTPENRSFDGTGEALTAFGNVKPKDLVGIPWMVAFALRADGWYLRSDIIWNKPNPMPESVTDRPTKSHEYIFLLSKSQRYYYDAEAIKVPSDRAGEICGTGPKSLSRGTAQGQNVKASGNAVAGGFVISPELANKRSVWTVTTQPFSDAHFATFPPELINPCILAGSRCGDLVVDPFAGSGTTGKVAIELGRKACLIEPKAEYIEMIKKRCQTTIGLPL